MIKTCNTCHHTGELTWRDGKYYCAMCGAEISEYQPQAQVYPQGNTVVSNVTCPICKNQENNVFDGVKYRCALCGTPFDPQQEMQAPAYEQYANVYTDNRSQQVQKVKKEKDKNLGLAILFVFLFWPVSIYFFYKFYQAEKELKAMGY